MSEPKPMQADINCFEKFVRLMEERREVLRAKGIDMAPGEPWSSPINTHEFFNALQEVPADEWHEPWNKPFWNFLHVGGHLPH